MEERIEYMILNGELQPLQHSHSAYIYQDIHTLAHQSRLTAQYLQIIDHAASVLFGIEGWLSIKEVEEDIAKLLQHNHATRNTSVRVRLKIYASGDYSLEQDKASIYKGYTMRSLRVNASFIAATAPLNHYPTSAMVATKEFLAEMAQARELNLAIMANAEGEIIPDAVNPLFMIQANTLYAPPLPKPSVEQQIIERAAVKLGLQVVREPISVKQTKLADEIFISSWQGITSVAHIDHRPYGSTLSERIAIGMEDEFRL